MHSIAKSFAACLEEEKNVLQLCFAHKQSRIAFRHNALPQKRKENYGEIVIVLCVCI